MSDAAWKQFEREAAALFDGARFWANAGERLDFAGELDGLVVHGQCKLVQKLSLNALTELAEEMDRRAETAAPGVPSAGVVCVKVRRGRGLPSAPLVVMTFDQFRNLHSKEAT